MHESIVLEELQASIGDLMVANAVLWATWNRNGKNEYLSFTDRQLTVNHYTNALQKDCSFESWKGSKNKIKLKCMEMLLLNLAH